MKGKPTERLIPNLNKKETYVVHYRNLQQYVSHGLKVTKVHHLIMFQQSNWLKKYIDLNTEKRKAAKNPFEKVLGKMKDECAGLPIQEFVGLRSKMYSLMYGGGEENRTAKGITRACQRRMKHEQYKKSLFEGTQTKVVGHVIRSHDHEMFSGKVHKVALSPFDDKRYVLDDGCTTLAHGHYGI